MKKLLIIILVLFSSSISAEESTSGYRKITRIYINGIDRVNFYLDSNCPAGEQYYSLRPERVDVNRFYSTILAAFHADKKVLVKWESPASLCEVTRVFVQ